MRYFFLLCFYSCSAAFACKCTEENGLATKENTNRYDVIFIGKVDSVSACNKKSIAYFNVSELFKGVPAKQISVRFDCFSSCQLSISKGETWLMYCSFFKYAKLETVFCSRSRKHFENEQDDYYQISNKMSFEEELTFLRTHYTSQKLTADKNQVRGFSRELIKPGGLGLLGLLLCSLLGLGFIYFLLNKLFK